METVWLASSGNWKTVEKVVIDEIGQEVRILFRFYYFIVIMFKGTRCRKMD